MPFTDEGRFTLSTFDRRESVWRSREKCYVACNIVQHDRFGGDSVMVWGGISMEGRTDLYRLDNGTLTAIIYWVEMCHDSLQNLFCDIILKLEK